MNKTQKQKLEDKYLKAKIKYYEGEPFLTDTEFDALEELLRKEGSKVIEQIGSKRKDFDFEHPTKMLSLNKIQTETVDTIDLISETTTDYKVVPVRSWYDKRTVILDNTPTLLSSPKFDGSAINIIYKDNKIFNILTRGDGNTGKNVTERLTPYLDNLLTEPLNEGDVLEVRCEVVINKKLFNKKYGTEYANARNYVAGVLGKDDYDKVKVSELEIIPLIFILNGDYVAQSMFDNTPCFSKYYTKYFHINDYASTIQMYEKLREDFEFQLDGVVIAFEEKYRKILGENKHDPEWSIAIKFVPKEAITTVIGFEWNVSKRGEVQPVILLEPVQLDGTTVKRCSGYNAGYLVTNKLKIGSLVSIHKSGDIIPEISSIISS